MPDPKVDLNCPICGTPLTYLTDEGTTHVYRCLRHGRVILMRDGMVMLQPQ